jgi:hypothetical protein
MDRQWRTGWADEHRSVGTGRIREAGDSRDVQAVDVDEEEEKEGRNDMEQPPIDEVQRRSREERRERRDAEEVRRRLDRLSPLLHDLITWDLVYRTESGSFLLREDVQRWLEEAAARRTRSAPEVYVGRPCQRCGACGVTRMVEGVRLCDACRQSATVDETVHVESRAPKRHGHHDARSWWSHKAG